MTEVLAVTTILGLVPSVPPSESPYRTYYNGRFSNGPVAVEYLWELLCGAAPDSKGGLQPFFGQGSPGASRAIDFAFGGTGTPYLDQTPGGFWAPGLKGQIELYRASVRGRGPTSRALFVIATGSNDYRDDPFNVPMDPGVVVENIIALDALFPTPDLWPFGVPTSLCLFVLPAACQDADFDVVGQLGVPFVFWDVVHPTTDAHRFLGEFLFASITN